MFFIFISAGLAIILLYLFFLHWRLREKGAEISLQLQNLEERRNLMGAEILRERRAIESFREKIVRYRELKGLTERLSLCLSLHDTSTTISQEVNTLFGRNDRTIILYLFHSKTGELGISASHKGEMRVNIKSKKGDVFDQWVARTMQPLLVEDAKTDYRFDTDRIVAEEPRLLRSIMAIPLIVGRKALGILRIDSPHEKDFTTEDLRFLTTIADLGAVAIENAQLYEHVEQLAIKDSLTGLYLRRHLLERLSLETSHQLRGKGQLSFLMLDLDKFKQYNDRFGHVAGDIVLRTIGKLLTSFFQRQGDLVCRYGGEEFSVLLLDCLKTKAFELAEGIRQKIAEETIVLRRERTHITVSIGVAAVPVDAVNPRELIHKADAALYRAKERGRNQVCAA